MKRLTLELRVGFFAVLAILLILIFAIVKGQFSFQRGGYEVKAVFKYVAGVDRGSPVHVSGVSVGEVKKVVVDYSKDPRVLVTLYLDRSVKLGRHSQVFIRSFGLIGEKYVEIIPTSLTDTPLIQPNETLSGTEPLPIDRLLAMGEDLGRNIQGMVSSVDKIFGDPKFKEGLYTTLDQIKVMSIQGNKTLASIQAAAMDLQSASIKAQELLYSAQDVVEQTKPALVQSLLNFQIASAGLASVSQQMSEVMTKIQGDDSTLGQLISSGDLYRKMDKSLTDLEKSAGRFAAASENIKDLSLDVKTGKGSAGKFLTSDELYNEVKGFISDLRAKPWRLLRPGS
ncbi:MAG: MlaD family protein [Candidatus Ratteibacteria bacterium]|jgi:phospholipid/cholesterol/gamma-HCH transport system substrate-binding protein